MTSVSSSTVPRERCQRSIREIRPMNDCTFWKKDEAGRVRTSSRIVSAFSKPPSTVSGGDSMSGSMLLSSSLRKRPSPPALTARPSRSRNQDTKHLSMCKTWSVKLLRSKNNSGTNLLG